MVRRRRDLLMNIGRVGLHLITNVESETGIPYYCVTLRGTPVHRPTEDMTARLDPSAARHIADKLYEYADRVEQQNLRREKLSGHQESLSAHGPILPARAVEDTDTTPRHVPFPPANT